MRSLSSGKDVAHTIARKNKSRAKATVAIIVPLPTYRRRPKPRVLLNSFEMTDHEIIAKSRTRCRSRQRIPGRHQRHPKQRKHLTKDRCHIAERYVAARSIRRSFFACGTFDYVPSVGQLELARRQRPDGLGEAKPSEIDRSHAVLKYARPAVSGLHEGEHGAVT